MLEMKNFNKFRLKMAAFAAVVLMCAAPAAVKAQGTIGSSASNPFPIKTPGQLTSLAERVNAGGSFYFDPADSLYYADNGTGRVLIANKAQDAFFKLTADIELNTADVASSEGVGSFNVWTPIGNTNMHPFDGDFNGDNHLIIGAFVNQPGTDNAGVFGQTANHATIRHLGVVKSYICGKSDVGGIVGKAIGSRIDSCFFFGTVNANDAHVGGIVGMIATSTVVNNCYANAIVSATVSQVGGIVGCTDNAGDPCTISNCYSSSILRGYQRYTGGVLGEDKHSQTVLTNLYYDQQMINMLTAGISPNSISGITGLNTTDMINGTWAPTGFTASGAGFYPHIDGFDVPSGSVGFLSLVPIILPAGATLSDLSSVSEITLGGGSAVTWAVVEIVGNASVEGSTLTVNGQSFVNLSVTAGGVTRTYPFRFEKEPLIGTATNPFPINTLADLTAFRNGINTGAPFSYKHFTVPAFGENTFFLQTANITMPNNNWLSIGSTSETPFKGTYDGGEHAVIGWYYATASGVTNDYAFFRYTDNATIKNLTMQGVRTGNYASLICFMKAGTVDNCHATGSSAVKGGLIHQTTIYDGTAYIRNCTNRNNIDASGNLGGIVRSLGTKYNVMENCHNYGNVKGTTRVGGLVGWAETNSGATLTMTNCSNHGKIENYSNGNEACVGGLVGNLTCTITYCYNTGEVKGYLKVGGIIAIGGTVSYCYNVGNITCGASSNAGARGDAAVYGIAPNAPNHCFNTGRITNYSTNNAYGIGYGTTNNGVVTSTPQDCFNAGEVMTHVNGTSYGISNTTATRSYQIGRVMGGDKQVKCTYYDAARVPSFSSTTATAKTTAQMTSGSLMSSAVNWVEEAGMYPRIKGLDTLTISKAVALPIFFGNASDNVDHVSANFTVAYKYGIKWQIEGTSGATIADSNATLQKVTLPANRTNGNIILAAKKGDSVYYRVTLVMAVNAPADTLTVDNLTDLQNLRDGINSGSAFSYKGTAVPAGGEGTTFQLTADFDMPTSSWTSIGTIDNAFKGTFDGNNHTLNKLTQSGRNVAGLFGYVEGGTVKNLTLDNVDITSFQFGGSVCGCLRSGTVKNCKTYGTMNGGGTEYHAHRHVGCVVGTATGTSRIISCENYINFTYSNLESPYGSVGGIVGCASTNTDVDTCINAGNIKGGEFVAGICANGGKLHKCINYGEITGVALTVGLAGIATQSGDGHGYIVAVAPACYECVNSGKVVSSVVSKTCYVAGVCRGGTTQRCYNAGMVIGSNAAYVAGVEVGGYEVTRCFNVGQVTGTGTVRAVTNSTGTVTNCFYDKQMCTATDPHAGVTPKTTIEMCGNSLRTDLLNDTYFIYQDSMYPRVKGIENLDASKAIAAPVFLDARDSVNMVEYDFVTGGCNNHNVTWTTDGTAIEITGCTDHIAVPGLPNMMAGMGTTVYKKVQLQVRMDAFIIKDSAELVHFQQRIGSGGVFYYNPVDSTYKLTTDPTYITVPAKGEGAEFRVSADIDLHGKVWTPATLFKGTLDGDGHTIRNFTLSNSDSDRKGLFATTDQAFIKNLTLENVTANVTNTYVGALAGYMEATNLNNVTIKNCNLVSSKNDLGGVAGYASKCNTTNITVLNNTITGAARVGGIVGEWVGNSLTNSYAKGCVITGSGDCVGGMAGSITQNGISFTQSNNIVDTCTVTGASYVGGFCGSHSYNHGGNPRSIHVRGGSVTGSGNRVGGLYGGGDGLGISIADGHPEQYCSNSASVKGNNYVGGLIGYKGYRELYYGVNTGSVEGNNYVGGIIGKDYGDGPGHASVRYCVNAGVVKGNMYVGGIRGNAYHSSEVAVYQCVNIGDVTGNQYVGGLIGESKGTSYYNVNAGRVTGSSYVGGLVGSQTDYPGYSRKTYYCVSSGQVYGDENVGSIVGYYEEGTVQNCYYDKQISGRVKGAGNNSADVAGVAEGKMTAAMLGSNLQSVLGNNNTFSYLNGLYPRPSTIVNLDGAKVAAMPIPMVDTITAYTIPGIADYPIYPTTQESVTWSITEGNSLYKSLTTLKAQNAGGSVVTASLNGFSKNIDFMVGVSSTMPCVIKDYTALQAFTNCVNSGHDFYYRTSDSTYHLTRPGSGVDIVPVATGGEGGFFKLNFSPSYSVSNEWAGRIGTTASPFKGEFNGNNQTVTNLTNATADTCGFFGYNAGQVFNLNFVNSNMGTANHSCVGAVAGYNTGRIDSCHVMNGVVKGVNYVGGIAGNNAGFVSACYSSATVAATGYVGGVTGYNSGSVASCFNLGEITGKSYTGGVVGQNTATLTNSYNAGNINGDGTSNYVGGVAGQTGANISYCYNSGNIDATGTNIGSVAGSCTSQTIPSLAYDNQMSIVSAFDGSNYQALSANTINMVGTSLQSRLGTENWVYADSLYPRLRGMETSDAAVLSATPVFLSDGERVTSVEHAFRVYTYNNNVTWTTESPALNMTAVPEVSFNTCGQPVLAATRNEESKNVKLQISYTAAVEHADTTCGEDYTWDINHVTYSASNTVVVSTIGDDGCPYTHTLRITIPTPMSVSLSSTPELCTDANNGTATVTVTGGLGNQFNYAWSSSEPRDLATANNQGRSHTVSNLSPDYEYMVTVTDAVNVTNTCTVTGSVSVTEAVPLVATLDTASSGCYGSVDGMFEVSFSGGRPPYKVTWSGASTGTRSNISDPANHYRVEGLNNGNYHITVWDANNCTKEFDTSLVQDNNTYTISAFDTTKKYDGVAVNAARYILQIGSGAPDTIASGHSKTLANGDVLTATVDRTTLTDAGVYLNSVTDYQVMRGTQDVTCQYNIIPRNRNIIINKRHVTLTSADTMTFHPNNAAISRVTVTGDGFVVGETVSYNVTGFRSGDNPGSSDNVFTINWLTANPNNYDTTKVYGTLIVVKNGILVVRGSNLDKVYDGVPVTYTPTGSESYTAVGMKVKVYGEDGYCGCPSDTIYGLGPEYRIEVVMNNGSQITVKDADTTEFRVTSIHAYYNDGVNDRDVTSSFERIDTTHGSLKISRRPVQLSTQGNSWVYDATAHSLPDVTMIGSFVDGEVTEAPSASASITEVGEVVNAIDYHPSTDPNVFKLSNYNITKTEGTLKVTARPLYITGVDRYVDVTGELQYTDEFTITNLVSGHTASGLTFRAEGTDIGSYPGAFSGTLEVKDAGDHDVLGNYEEHRTPGVLYINSPDKELRVVSATSSTMYSGAPITDQTYTVTFGYQTVAPLASNPRQYKLSTGDTVQITPTNTGATGITNVGNFRNDFAISFIPSAHAVNYNRITLDTGIVTVTKRDVRLISMSKTKVYDATGVAWDSVQAGGSGFVEGEGATYSNFRGGTTYTNVGTYTHANTFLYELISGTLASNYTITQEYGDLAVTKATLTVKADDIERVYGEPNEYTYTIDGYQGSDGVSVVHGLDADHPSFTCTGGQFSAIGNNYIITPVLTGLSADNYDFVAATGILTVKKRSLVINAPSVTVGYDGTVHDQTTNPITGTITYTGLATGDAATATMTYSRRPGGETPMGFSTCTVLHGGSDVTGNYNITVNEASKLIITKRALTVKVKDASKTYDGNALVATEYEIVSGEVGTGDEITDVIYTGSQTNAGTSTSGFEQLRIVYGSTPVHEDSYNLTLQGGTLTVNPKAVTVTADDKEKVYGATDPSLTATVEGLVSGESTSLITYSVARATGENVGHYTITPSGDATQGNYSVSYTTGDFEITKAALTVKVDNKNKTYGAADPDNSVTMTGLKNGDTQDAILSLLGINYSRTPGEEVDTYTITATGAATIANYNVTYQTGTLTIGKAELTVTADTKSKVYGTTPDPALTTTISGLQNGDVETTIRTVLNINLTRAAGETVGDYAYTFNSPVNSLDNYTVTYDATTNKFSITRATATVTAGNKSKTFDNNSETDPPLTATVSGLQNGDAASVISYTLSREAGQNVDTYDIIPAGDAVQGNYNVTYVNGTFTINAKEVTVTADPKSKTYGETDPDLTATVTGLVGSDNVTYTLTRATGETAQTYTITPSGASTQGNYSVSYIPGLFTINPDTLTVTANNKSREYGEENPHFDTLISGFITGETETALREADKLSGTVTCSCEATPSSAPDTYDIVPDISQLTATNYVFKAVNGTLTVTNSTKDIAISSEDKSWEFDGTEHKWEKYHVTYGGTELTAVAESNGKQFAIPGTGDILTITPATTAKITNVAESNVANAFTYELSNATRYATPTTSTGNLSVTKKDLAITITKTKTYDHTNLTVAYNDATAVTATGLVTSDALTAGEVSTSSAAANVYNTSTSNITTAFATTKGIANYEVTYNITLTINRATMTVTCPDAAACTKMYDGTALHPVATCTPSDNSAAKIEYSTTGTWSETAPSITNVAEGPLTVNVRASNPNYDTATCNYQLTISKRPITVTAADKQFEYDGAAHVWHEVASYGTYGLINSDAMSFTFSDASTITTVNESPVANVITGHSFTTGTASNYDVQPYVNGSLTMVYGTPIDLTITARDTAWVFDATTHTFHSFTVQRGTDVAVTVPVSANGEYTFANGDKLTVHFDPNSKITDNETAGVENTIINNNYTLYHGTTDVHEAYNVHFVAGLLRILPDTITITAKDSAFVYDGSEKSQPHYTVTGLVGDASVNAVISGAIQYVSQSPVDNVVTSHSFLSGNPNNYFVKYAKGTLTMAYESPQPTVKITAKSGSWTYDGMAHSKDSCTVEFGGNTYQVGPAGNVTLAHGDELHVDITGSITEQGSINNVVEDSWTITNNGVNVASGYSVQTVNGTLTVTRLGGVVVNITGNHSAATYDGAEHTATDYEVTSISNPLFTASDIVFSGTASAARTHAGTTNMNLAETMFSTDNDNFTDVDFVVEDGYITIDEKELTITAKDSTFVYDGTEKTQPYYIITGLVGSDAISGVTTSGTIQYVNQSPVVNRVDTSAYSFTSGLRSDYDITLVNGTLRMNYGAPVNLEITSAGDTWVYDGTAHSKDGFTYRINGADYTSTSNSATIEGSNGDVITLTLGTSVTNVTAGTPNNIVSYTIMNGTTDVRSRYNVTLHTGDLVVTPKAATITAASQTWTYDGTAHSNAHYTVTGMIAPDTLTATITGSITYPGTQANTVTSFSMTTGQATNYNFTTVPGELKVVMGTPIALTITPASASKIYDGTPLTADSYTLTYGGNDYTVGADGYYTFPNGDKLYVDIQGTKTHVNDVANNHVNGTPVVMNGTTDVSAAYDITYSATGTLTITPRELTLTSGSSSKTYDTEPLVNHTVTAVGLVADGTTLTASNYTDWIDDFVGPGVQTNSFNVTGIPADYTPVKIYGTLTVNEPTAVTLTITGNSGTFVYDGTEHEVHGYTWVSSNPTLYNASSFRYKSGAAYENDSIAKRTVAGTQTMALSAADFENLNPAFTVNFAVTPGTVTITPKTSPIVITARDSSKVYDGTALTRNEVTYTDGVLVSGDVLTATVVGTITNAGQVSNQVASYQVMRSGVDVTSCYTFGSSISGVLTVTKRPVTLTSGSDSKTYDGTALTKNEVTASTGANVGFVGTDGFTPNVTGTRTDVGSSPNTFTYTLNSGTVADNYTVSTVEGTLTVNPLADVVVTITEHGSTLTYDGAPHTVTGYDFSASSSLYQQSYMSFNGTASVTGTNAGTYPMTLTASQFTNTNPNFSNVTFTIADGSLVINPVSTEVTVTITGNNLTRMYDGNEYTVSGYTWSADNPLYTAACFSTTNPATASLTNVGQENMGLANTSFTNISTNFTDVTFNVTDGYVKITPNTSALTLTCPTNTTHVYDGNAYSADAATANVTAGTTIEYSTDGGTTWSTTIPSRTAAGATTVKVRATNDNYTTATCEYSLSVTPSPVVVTAGSQQFTYTGAAQSYDHYTVTGLTAADAALFTATVTGSITYPSEGTVANRITGHTFGTGFSAESNYTFTDVNGALTMVYGPATELAITTGSYEDAYDGATHTVSTYTVVEGTLTAQNSDANRQVRLSNGDTLTVNFNGVGVTNVADGTLSNSISGAVITNHGHDVSANYHVTTTAGTLKVTKKAITVTGDSHEFTYTGSAQTWPKYTVTGLVGTDTLTVTMTGSITYPGDVVPNVPGEPYNFFRGSADNYTVNFANGTLTMGWPDATDVVVKAATDTMVYNGSPLSNGAYTVTVGGATVSVPAGGSYTFTNGDVLTATISGSVTHVSESSATANHVGNVTIMHGTVDVSSAYNVTKRDTALVIKKRTVTLTSASDSKTYDTHELTNHTVTVGDMGFAPGEDTASCTFSGTQTIPGSSENFFNYTLTSATNANDYIIEKQYGTLTVNAAGTVTVTITENSGTETYDGTQKTVTGYTVTSISDPNYTESMFNFTGTASVSGTKAGTYNMNLQSSDFSNNTGNSFTVEFVIVDGALTIEPVATPIVLTAGSASKVYDGTALTNNTFSITSGALATGDEIRTTSTGSITHVGVATNSIATCRVFNSADEDVTNCYTFGTHINGQLEINTRPVTLTSATQTWTYDGQAHTNSTVTPSTGTNEGFVSGEGATYNVTGSITNVGTADNMFTYSLTSATRAADYNVTVAYGVLEVTPMDGITVNITGNHDSQVYDGTAKTVTGYTVDAGTTWNPYYSAANVTCDTVATATQTVVGTKNMDLAARHFHNTNPNFTNVNFNVTDGYMTITQITEPITITAASDSKMYDGTALTNNGFTYTGTLATGDRLEAVVEGTVTHVSQGNVANVVTSYKVLNSSDVDVTASYTFNTSVDGVLNITKRDVTLTSASATRNYNGTALTAETVTVSGSGFVTGEGPSSYTNFASQTHYGSCDNTFEYSLQTGAEATDYDIDTVKGTLTVDKADLLITSATHSFLYDGQTHSDNTYSIMLNGTQVNDIAAGDYTMSTNDVLTVTFPTTSSILRPSQTPTANAFTYTIGTNADDYEVTTVNGMLSMSISTVQMPLTITTGSKTWTYDGQSHSYKAYTVEENWTGGTTHDVAESANGEVVLSTGDRLYVNIGGSIENYSQSPLNNIINTITITRDGEDVSAAYEVTTHLGQLRIDQRPLLITGDTAAFVYDGEVHQSTICHVYGLVTGEDVLVQATGSIQFPSQSPATNPVGSYTFTAGSVNNYAVTTVPGQLTMTFVPTAITLEANTTAWNYDGNAHSDARYKLTVGSNVYQNVAAGDYAFPNGDVMTVTVTGSVTNYDASYSNNNVVAITSIKHDGVDVSGNYTPTLTPGTLSINRIPVTVTITGNNSNVPYNGSEQVVDGYTVSINEPLYTTADFTFAGSTDHAARTDVGTTYMTMVADNFTNTNTNFNPVTFTVNNGSITISPIDAVVTITGNTDSKMYDGTAHSVTGYTATANTALYDVAHDFTYAGDSIATRTDAGTTNMDLVATDFANANTNFANVTFEINDGAMTITPRTGVVVTVQEHGREVEWDGSTQTVNGYSVSINDPLYQESYIHFSGTALAYGDGDENYLRTYPMMLNESDFSNTNDNFTGVTFTILDSALYIYPKLKASATTTQVFCHLGNNGTATIEVTGGKANNGKYSFAIDGGTAAEYDPTHTFTGFEAGDHYVVVTDSLNYTVRVDFEITEIAELTATIVTPTELCPNQGSYPVSVTVAGGTTDYSYVWSGDATAANANATTVNQIGANDGEQAYNVTVVVTDHNTCTVTATGSFRVKPSVSKPGSITYTCAADTNIVLNYGAVDTMIILNQPTYTDLSDQGMNLLLWAEGLHGSNRYAVPEGLEDTVYIVKWHLKDACNDDSLICTQRVKVIYPACTPAELGGVTYQAVRLGGNCWTRANLMVVPAPLSRAASPNGTYKYNNDDALAAQYGYLYTWYAACHVTENDNSAVPTVSNGHVQGICPDNWALPTAEDFIYMVDAIGGVPHMKIADDNFWISGLEGTAPSSGFDALGAGYYRSSSDSFEGLMSVARFWTATPSGSSVSGTAVQCAVCVGEDVLIAPKADGYSVRCVKVQ